MGGVDFRIKAKGRTLSEAYNNAVERYEDEEGSNPYNGTISTTEGVTDLTNKYKMSKMDLEKFIEKELERCGKRNCYAICVKEPVANPSKIKSRVENLHTPGKKEWILQYEVSTINDRWVGKAEQKLDAVKIAREFTEKHQADTKIVVMRELKGSSNLVAKIYYKKSNKETPGEWILFGIAAY